MLGGCGLLLPSGCQGVGGPCPACRTSLQGCLSHCPWDHLTLHLLWRPECGTVVTDADAGG